MNHVHVVDLFGDPEVKLNGAQVDCLGETLVSMWKVKLAIDFPGRTFEVLYDGRDREDLLECVVTFRQAVRE